MTTYLGKSCSFGLPRVPFVNCRQFMYLVMPLLVLRAGCGIWLYQFLIIAYLFTLPPPWIQLSSLYTKLIAKRNGHVHLTTLITVVFLRFQKPEKPSTWNFHQSLIFQLAKHACKSCGQKICHFKAETTVFFKSCKIPAKHVKQHLNI